MHIKNNFFWKSYRLWDSVEKYGKERQAADDSIIRDMRFACWLTKATDTHSEYAVLTVFPQQQWLRERASVLRIRTLPQLFLLKNRELVLHVALVQYSALWNWTFTEAAMQFVLSSQGKNRSYCHDTMCFFYPFVHL